MVTTLCPLLLAFVMTAFTVPPATAQTPTDPKELVGEWSGKWSGVWGTGSQARSGDYVLRVSKVEGNKVFGEVEWTTKGTSRTNVVGTFDGRRLKYGNAELIVDGNRMTGGRPVENFPQGIKIDLTKAK